MKVTVKTVKQEESSFEVEPTDTVRSFKEKIAAEKNTTPESIKLIFSGKMLNDDSATLESVKVKEGSSFVIMIRKTAAPAPAAAAPVTPASAPAATVPPATPSKPATGERQEAPVTPTTTATASGPSEGNISRLCEMGFEREQVIRALRAAFNNPDRAVEYLMSGIPDGVGMEDIPERAPADNGRFEAGTNPMGNFVGGNNGGSDFPMPGITDDDVPGAVAPAAPDERAEAASALVEVFGMLAQQPQFRQMCQAAKQNPQHLAQLVQGLSSVNPQLGQLIRANPQTFAHLVNNIDNIPVVEGVFGSEDDGDGDVSDHGHDHPHVAAAPAGGIAAQLTQEDREAIQRLAALGFDPSLCAQAYIACDKNEGLAANWLLDHGFD